MIKNIFENKGGLQKIIAIIFVLFLILLVGMIFSSAQEIIENQGSNLIWKSEEIVEGISENIVKEVTEIEEVNFLEENEGEINNFCVNVICEDLSLECPDGFVVSCSNVCDSETGECSQCEPHCIGHEVILLEEPNEINSTPEENITIPINETNQTTLELLTLPEDTNETDNNETIEDEMGNEIVVEENETSETPITGDVISEIPAELNLEIFHQDKIIRGEILEIKAIITNPGSKVKNVEVIWILPEGFELISKNQESCENLNTGESCELIIRVQTSLSTSLGKGEIKVIVSY